MRDARHPVSNRTANMFIGMKDSQWLEIEDEWCRKMAEEATHARHEIETRLAIAREKRLSRQSPQMTRALEIEIATLQRIREELEFDIESWIRPSSHPDDHQEVESGSMVG
jgi:hypothetical protein